MSGGPDTLALESAAWTIERQDLQTKLHRLAAECRSNSHVEVLASVEEGPIADALRGYALRHAVDLIVMATHARRGMARAFFGDITGQLIRETGIPVLVVRPPSLATELVDGPCYKRILVPLDGSSLAEQSLEPALTLAALEQAQVTLLRVVTPGKTPPGTEAGASPSGRSAGVDEAERYLSKVRMALASRDVRIHSAVVVADDIPRAIAGFAEASDEDLIAIATHGRGMMARAIAGSVADRVMSEGMLSMLVVHPAELAVTERVGQTPLVLPLAMA